MRVSQVVALEADAKAQTAKVLAPLHQVMKKCDVYEGSVKSYRTLREDEPSRDPQVVRVRLKAKDATEQMAAAWARWADLVAQRDWANCEARADVVVDGEVLIPAVPVTTLLWLEKQITDVRKAIDVIPTLDEAEDWEWDADNGVYRTVRPVQAHKTRKVQEPLVLYPATEQHPAQTQLISRDIDVGYWEGRRFSGALAEAEKRRMLARVTKVLEAVRVAREDANRCEAPSKNIGQKVFGLLFGIDAGAA